MSLIKSCERCGLPDCAWVAGPYCEGQARTDALRAFAPEWRPLPRWQRWLAKLVARHVIELECENSYFRSIVKKEYDNVRLVDVNVRPDEFQLLLRSGVGGILVSWMLQAIRSIGAKAYVEVMGEHPQEGKVTFTIARMGGEAPGARAARYENIIRSYVSPRPKEDYHEDMGSVLWWTLDEDGHPTEPPFAGTPDTMMPVHVIMGQVDIDEDGRVVGNKELGGSVHTINRDCCPPYVTHFTRIPEASLQWRPPEPDAESVRINPSTGDKV